MSIKGGACRPSPRAVDILGVRVSGNNLTEAVEVIASWITSRDRQFVCLTGVHGVIESQRDPAVMAAHQAAGLVLSDGMPMVWCAHAAGLKSESHVRGADLMEAVLARSLCEGWRHYFYGSSDQVLAALVRQVTSIYPGIQIAGTLSPPYRPLSREEGRHIASAINAAEPDILWVGLSTPKQELWMSEWRQEVVAPVMLGVGAAFDFHAQTRRQAPIWLRNTGFEWLYRLMLEPRRLWRRYLYNNTRFIVAIAKHWPRAFD